MIRRAVHSDPTQVLAMFELYLAAVRRPEVRDALGEMVTANADATVELHRASGLASGTEPAALLNACLLGVMVSELALDPKALRAIGLDDIDEVGGQLFDATTDDCPQVGRPLSARARFVEG